MTTVIRGKIEYIELNNFKSYYGYHRIGPLKNFQAIIGPNGAGKSNLMDAVSFVLGVRARHLRGTHLADLIARPRREADDDDQENDDREPNATETPSAKRLRSTKSSVQLTFLASNGTRKLFQRSITPKQSHSSTNTTSQSEYRLDHTVVSEKEYQTALESIGVLVNAKNFLVFQGDVASVANKSAKELTKLFETISGSGELESEYNNAFELKRAAEENTIFAFHKKKGMIAEKNEFKKMKKEAEDYEELRNKCETIRKHRILCTLRHLAKGIEKFQSSKLLIEKDIAAADKVLAKAEKELNVQKSTQAKKHKEHIQKEREVAKIQSKADSLLPKSIAAKEKVTHTKKLIENAQEELLKATEESTANKELIKSLENRLSDLRTLQKNKEHELEQAERAAVTLTPAQRQEYQTALAELQTQVSAVELQLECGLRDKALSDENIRTLKLRESELLRKIQSLEESLEKISSRKEKIELFHKELTTKLHETKENEKKRREEYENTLKQFETKQAELDAVNDKLSLFKQERTQTEQEEKFVSVVESLSELFPGRVHGRLCDLCHPTSRKYKQCGAIVLGKHMDAIVVDNTETAHECVSVLRTQRCRPAIFLPLNNLIVKTITDDMRMQINDNPTARFALDVLSCDSQYEKALAFAVGTTIICESLDEAQSLAFAKHKSSHGSVERHRVVTIDGSIISKSGLMSGGKVDSQAHKWDSKELNKLKNLRHALTDTVAKLREQLFACESSSTSGSEMTQNIATISAKREFAKTELDSTAKNAKTYESEIAEAKRELAKQQKLIAENEAKSAEFAEKIDRFQKKIASVSAEVFSSLSKRLGVEDIHTAERERAQRQRESDEERARLTIAINKLESQLNFANHRAQNDPKAIAERHIAELQNELKKANTEASNVEREIEERKANVEKVREESNALREEYLALESETKRMRNDVDEKQKNRNVLQKRKTAEEAQLTRLLSRRHDCFTKARVEQLLKLPDEEEADNEKENESEGDSQEKRDRLFEIESEYEIDFDEVNSLYKVSTLAQYQSLLETFDRDQAHLEGMLSILNPNLKAREHMANAQSKALDAGKAFEDTRKTAREAAEHFEQVKEERTRKFLSAFEHISKSIDSVYKLLTRTRDAPLGGQAFLTLENTEEPFNGGIVYTATPPAKRFHELESLSGGEKTMAALALLFAVHSFHPSPFFILDEVDAALDNTNVSQVAKYILEQSHTVQFIVISLKDSLYSFANALVGISRNQSTKSSVTFTFDLDPYANN